MKKRTLLKGALALALPIVYRPVHTTAAGTTAPTRDNATTPLFSGLSGLDHALGGLAAGDLLGVSGPPATGKTVLLLDLAARICCGYGKNVIFWSAHQPCHSLVQKGTIKDVPRAHFLTEPAFVDLWDQGMSYSPAVVVVHSASAEPSRAHDIADLLSAEHPAGCAALVMDGWGTVPERREEIALVDRMAVFAAERWPHALLSEEELDQAKQFAQVNRLPVVMGVTTASLVDDESLAESFYLEERLRIAVDRLVSLHRPELYLETSQKAAADQHVVCLSGRSLRRWDTRRSKLRFDPRRLGFSTVN
jgi:DnaB-like helicase C terminal domain